MARRPLPRILSNGSASIARSREMARTAADGATDVLHPLITITRGLRRLAAAGRRKWVGTPKERRSPLLFLAGAVVLVLVFLPYAPLLALICLMAVAAWKGRDPKQAEPTGPDESQVQRLSSLYEALVPYFSVADDPSPLYAHGGEWENAFESYEFDGDGRFESLAIRYPAYFTDGEPESRARIEQLLNAKLGRGREYHFGWDEEGNRLTVTVLAPLPTDIAAQRFVTSPGETVLGFTDETGVQRTLPVQDGDGQRDVPPVIWRTGIRSTEPHLLIVGQPGTGTTSLVRSVALQALQDGDVLVIEGSGTGDYASLIGRAGVLAVESGLAGARATLEWAAHETERRLIAANRARQAGHPAPEDIKRPLWILLDRPSALGHLAAADGRDDPQALLRVPLRHGRAAGVTVVVAEQFDSLGGLDEHVGAHTRARVVLGPATPAELLDVLGALPLTTPAADAPPGRGYARLGTGQVHRLQVPATPDPNDDATSDTHRQAVIALLPHHTTPRDATPPTPDASAAESIPPDAISHEPTRNALAEPGPPADPTRTGSPANSAEAGPRRNTAAGAGAAQGGTGGAAAARGGTAGAQARQSTTVGAGALQDTPAGAQAPHSTSAQAHAQAPHGTAAQATQSTAAQNQATQSTAAQAEAPLSTRARAEQPRTTGADAQTPENPSAEAASPQGTTARTEAARGTRALAGQPQNRGARTEPPQNTPAQVAQPQSAPAQAQQPESTPAQTPALQNTRAQAQRAQSEPSRTQAPESTPPQADPPRHAPAQAPQKTPAQDQQPQAKPAEAQAPENTSPQAEPPETGTPAVVPEPPETPLNRPEPPTVQPLAAEPPQTPPAQPEPPQIPPRPSQPPRHTPIQAKAPGGEIVQSEPLEAKPSPAESASTEPTPTETAPTRPTPAETAPTDADPTEADPTEAIPREAEALAER